jgi:hypothetical protein
MRSTNEGIVAKVSLMRRSSLYAGTTTAIVCSRYKCWCLLELNNEIDTFRIHNKVLLSSFLALMRAILLYLSKINANTIYMSNCRDIKPNGIKIKMLEI